MTGARLRFAHRAGWGLADLGVAVFNVVKQLLVFAYLTTHLGVPVGLAGAVTTGVLLFDMLTDPLVGWLSDRARHPWGRRAPFMVAGAPIMALSMVALFAVPPGPWAVVQVGAAFALASVGFTLVAVPYGAMAGEMTQDPAERSAMTAWRMGFASLGILLGGAVVPALAGRFGAAMAVALIGPVILGAIWGAVWLTRGAPRRAASSPLGWGAQLRLVAQNRAFVVLVVLYALMTLGVAVITAGMAFVAAHLVQASGVLAGAVAALGMLSVLFAAFTLGALGSQPFWAWLSGRIGKTWAICVGLLGYAGLLVWLYGALPAPVGVVGLLFVVGGLCNGAYQQIPWAMYPDLMDRTLARSGAALEGAQSALWLLGQKLANALGPLVLGLALQSAGWVHSTTGTVAQTEAAIARLQAVVTLLPAGVFGLAVLGLVLVYRPLMRA